MKNILLLCILFLVSCSTVIKKIDESSPSLALSGKELHLIFSHNLNGETHPCGCRQFPLGGLPQVAGLFHSIKEKQDILYVDTGDTFFPSSVIPKTMTKSLSFAAKNLAKGLDELGMKYLVPGDQDFALGLDFLKEIAGESKFEFLISNLKDESTIKHQKIAIYKNDQLTLFLAGIVHPETINSNDANYFLLPEVAMPEILNELKLRGYNQKDPHHRFILLSHSGIELDEELAAKFPQLDWIIGSHSQSFLRFSRDVGQVKIVQTLSKNHYMGDIILDLKNNKNSDRYELHEIRDELEKKMPNNPLRPFIENHKKKMNELQIEEQNQMTTQGMNGKDKIIKKLKTVSSCLQCHKSQVDFWQKTAHSLAYATLMNVKEQNNLQCVKCHSLGLGDPRGFNSSKTIIAFKNHPIIDYWPKAHTFSSQHKSIRALSSNEIQSISKKWLELDKASGIRHNFANVQCQNCHDKQDEHPFSIEIKEGPERKNLIKAKCIACHTVEQSPEWYHSEKKQQDAELNDKIFNQKYKKVSCPAIENP